MLCVASLNSSPPSAAYMRQWTQQPLLQVKKACRLFGARPLLEAMLMYCQLGPLGTNFSEIRLKNRNFSFMKSTQLTVVVAVLVPYSLPPLSIRHRPRRQVTSYIYRSIYTNTYRSSENVGILYLRHCFEFYVIILKNRYTQQGCPVYAISIQEVTLIGCDSPLLI